MEENTTTGRCRAAIVLSLLVAACSEDVDPRAVARGLRSPAVEEQPLPRLQSVDDARTSALPAPAPLGETGGKRFELRQQRACVVAIGRSIAEFVAPIPRRARPDEIAATIAFLLGPDAQFIHGAQFYVDGGIDALARPTQF